MNNWTTSWCIYNHNARQRRHFKVQSFHTIKGYKRMCNSSINNSNQRDIINETSISNQVVGTRDICSTQSKHLHFRLCLLRLLPFCHDMTKLITVVQERIWDWIISGANFFFEGSNTKKFIEINYQKNNICINRQSLCSLCSDVVHIIVKFNFLIII